MAKKNRKAPEPAGNDVATALDPFGYWPDLASRIPGLGGPTTATDANYAFHTSYVSTEPGPTGVRVQFSGLTATFGELTIRIFSYAEDRAVKVQEHRAAKAYLPDFAGRNRSIQVAFDAEPDIQYAIGGYVFGPTDAAATSVSIEIGRAATAPDEDDAAFKPSEFGLRRARRVFLLQSTSPPTFAFPASQSFSLEQTLEPEFGAWIAQLPKPPEELTAQWEIAYVLQALSIYGRLLPHARGLGFGRDDDPIGVIAKAEGCDILMEPSLPGSADQLPDHPTGFDFLWSTRAIANAPSELDARIFFGRTLDYVAPGGLAVHTFAVSSARQLPQAAQQTMIDQNAIRRIMLDIVSSGHIVAQLQFARDASIDEETPIPFGLVIRKTTLRG